MGNSLSSSGSVAVVNAVTKMDLDALNVILNQLTMEEKSDRKIYDEPDLANGHTPLHLCALCDFASGAEALMRCGADKNRKDLSGCTPLFLAAEKNHSSVANTLVMAGCALQVYTCISHNTLIFAHFCYFFLFRSSFLLFSSFGCCVVVVVVGTTNTSHTTTSGI